MLEDGERENGRMQEREYGIYSAMNLEVEIVLRASKYPIKRPNETPPRTCTFRKSQWNAPLNHSDTERCIF